MIVAFDESKPPAKYKDLVDQENVEQYDIEKVIRQFKNMDLGPPVHKNPLELDKKEDELPKAIPSIKSHPLDNVFGDLKKGVQTRTFTKTLANKKEDGESKKKRVKGSPNDYDLYIMNRYGYVVLMKNKSDSFEMFKEYKAEVEKQTREKYKSFMIRSWRGILKPQIQEFLEGV
ncbi:hypothetical protein AgCh_028181 [Apium graveolens]